MYQFVIDIDLRRGDDQKTHRLTIQAKTDHDRDDVVEEYVEAKMAQGWTCAGVSLVSMSPLQASQLD